MQETNMRAVDSHLRLFDYRGAVNVAVADVGMSTRMNPDAE
jgi:hypothetical protein